jgi:hypothetical protein
MDWVSSESVNLICMAKLSQGGHMWNNTLTLNSKVLWSVLQFGVFSLLLGSALPTHASTSQDFWQFVAIAPKQIPPVIEPAIAPVVEPTVDSEPPLLTPEQLGELRRWQEEFRRRREEQLQESNYWQRRQEFRQQQEAFRERQQELREQREEMRQRREDLRLRPNEFRQRYDDYRDDN